MPFAPTRPSFAPPPFPLPISSVPRADLWPLISPAERELLPHLSAGLSNKEIAVSLGKSPATVKAQVASVLRKLQLCSRTRLIAWLYAEGLAARS